MKIALIGDSLTEGRPGVPFIKLLEKQFPNHTMVNLGKPGETVESLYESLNKKPLNEEYDLIFLWIGINDVYTKLLKVQAKPPAENIEEFMNYYKKVVYILDQHSKKLILVTPSVVGEDLETTSNQEVQVLANSIQDLAINSEDVDVLDIRKTFVDQLKSEKSSDYLSLKVMTVMKDALFVKKPQKIDKLSHKRGLQLTMDGIHLNSRGAKLVADQFEKKIEELTVQQSMANL